MLGNSYGITGLIGYKKRIAGCWVIRIELPVRLAINRVLGNSYGITGLIGY